MLKVDELPMKDSLPTMPTKEKLMDDVKKAIHALDGVPRPVLESNTKLHSEDYWNIVKSFIGSYVAGKLTGTLMPATIIFYGILVFSILALLTFILFKAGIF